MGAVFNADEVLGMAVEIERNGRRFYLRAAEIADDAEMKKLFSELAEWEKGHEDLFASVRAELSDDEKAATVFDPEGEAALYLKAMADAHVFTAAADPASMLSDGETAADVLKKAVGFERDSILFFLGLRDLVPRRLGPEKVTELIKEEMSHVAYLVKRRRDI